jgi:hypothetical protein
VSSPDVEALEDDFVSLSMRNVEKELSVCVAGLFTLYDVWLCEQPFRFAALA